MRSCFFLEIITAPEENTFPFILVTYREAADRLKQGELPHRLERAGKLLVQALVATRHSRDVHLEDFTEILAGGLR